MAQDYKLLALDKGDNFQDAHGNYWVTAQFEGIQTEVKWVVKDPMTVKEGNSYYGEIKTQTSKAGKEYLRFYRESKPDAGQSNFSGFTSSQQGVPPSSSSSFGSNTKPAYQDNSDGQRQGMCFNNAANFVNRMFVPEDGKQLAVGPEMWANNVYAYANALYKLGDLGGETPNPKVQNGTTAMTPAAAGKPTKPWQINGRDTAAKLWPSEHQVDPDAEAASLYATIASAEEFPEADLPPGVF